MSFYMPHLPAPSHFLATRAQAPSTFHRHEVIGALSYAIDMTEGQPPGHAIRCCWIGMHIGQAHGLLPEQLNDLFYTLLLKDLGCSSNAARICALFLTDDISFKHDFKLVGPGLTATAQFVLRHAGAQADLAARVRRTLHIMRNRNSVAKELIETRCDQGANIANKLRFPQAVQDGIRSLDEHWDGGGQSTGLSGKDIPLLARIALLAQVVEVMFQEGGAKAALTQARRRSGSWFDPDLIEALQKASTKTDFLDMLSSPEIEAEVFKLAPKAAPIPVDNAYLDDIAEGFADVIDAKSPYTADHSRRVMLYTDMIGEEVGLSAPHRRWLRRAALLHDIGKLSVSNTILDKPGKPTAQEWIKIRQHPAHSAAILSRVSAFSDIAPVCGAHHERLDGTGYPMGQTADTLSVEAMILATADVYDALTADRPYRAALTTQHAFAILQEESGTALHPMFVAALATGVARLDHQPH